MPGAPLSLPEREEINVALIEDRAALGPRSPVASAAIRPPWPAR